jgi:hypothetical protein
MVNAYCCTHSQICRYHYAKVQEDSMIQRAFDDPTWHYMVLQAMSNAGPTSCCVQHVSGAIRYNHWLGLITVISSQEIYLFTPKANATFATSSTQRILKATAVDLTHTVPSWASLFIDIHFVPLRISDLYRLTILRIWLGKKAMCPLTGAEDDEEETSTANVLEGARSGW